MKCCEYGLYMFSDNKLLHALNKCEPDSLLALPDPTLPNTDFRTISTLSDLCDRELVATIGWAKQIPGNFLVKLIFVYVKQPPRQFFA
jgi:hypothetical protein